MQMREQTTIAIFGLVLYIPVNNFSVIRTDLPGLNQYLEAVLDRVSCSRTLHSDPTSNEVQTSNPLIPSLTLKAPLTTAADVKFCDIFPNFRQIYGMILHENRLPADDSHEISCLIGYF